MSEFRGIVCPTTCWACKFDQHDPEWHTWADEDDIAHCAATGQSDPSTQQCGCWCQKEKP